MGGGECDRKERRRCGQSAKTKTGENDKRVGKKEKGKFYKERSIHERKGKERRRSKEEDQHKRKEVRGRE